MAEIKTIHHMLTIWNASGQPTFFPPSLLPSLGDYLVDYLKSPEGERFLATLGYVRKDSQSHAT